MVFNMGSKFFKNEKLTLQSHPDLTALISPEKQTKFIRKRTKLVKKSSLKVPKLNIEDMKDKSIEKIP